MKIPFILVILLFFSCKQSTEVKQDQTNNIPVETIEESHESIDGVVTLNNGKLWQANPETTTGILTMKERMRLFSETENVQAYSLLKDNLQADFTELFEKCTMKGEAHEQLHNYLFPFIDLFEGLESTEIETCKKSFKDLSLHLESYTNYFK